MKKLFALLLAVGLTLSLCACGKTTIEGKGYGSPEEAITAYAEAMKTGDLSKIMATFAVETYVDRFDLEEYLDETRVYYPNLSVNPIPAQDAHTREMNIVFRQNAIARQQEYLYLYVAFGEPFDGKTITVGETGDYSSGAKLMRTLTQEDWMDILAEMEVGDIADYRDLDIEKDLWKNAEKQSYGRMEKYLDCDEVTGLAIEITLDGEDYYLCADLACYDGKWYVCNAGGMLIALVSASIHTGGLIPR